MNVKQFQIDDVKQMISLIYVIGRWGEECHLVGRLVENLQREIDLGIDQFVGSDHIESGV